MTDLMPNAECLAEAPDLESLCDRSFVRAHARGLSGSPKGARTP